MREIKFRAWNPIENKLEYWTLNDLCYHAPDRPDICLQNWQQYTGLHDLKGVEIYEGDIVEYQYLNTLGQEIRKAEVQLMPIGDVNKNIEAYYPFCYSISGAYKERDREITECFLTPPCDCEIIGNIYENHELLPDSTKRV